MAEVNDLLKDETAARLRDAWDETLKLKAGEEFRSLLESKKPSIPLGKTDQYKYETEVTERSANCSPKTYGNTPMQNKLSSIVT